jgi:hypothetical protein
MTNILGFLAILYDPSTGPTRVQLTDAPKSVCSEISVA